MRKVLLSFFFLTFCFIAIAQNTRSAENPRPPRPQYQAVKKENKGLFSFLKKKKGLELKTNQEEVADFRDRMKKVSRDKAKEQRKANKAQFTRHENFGHKRPPKKRPPGKQKFCKICKIKH